VNTRTRSRVVTFILVAILAVVVIASVLR